MKKLLIGILTILLFACGSNQQWVKPSQKSFSETWRNQFNNDALLVSGDFDGDNIQDTAYLATKGDELALVAELSSQNHSDQHIVDTYHDITLENIGITLGQKNSDVFVCGDNCESKEIKHLALDSIVFFVVESSKSVYIYNRQTKSFNEFWLSD